MCGKTNPKTSLIIIVLLVGLGLVANTNVCKSYDVYIFVDDMEDYNDRNDIREVWTDGNANVIWGPNQYLIRGGSSGSNLNVSSAVGSPTPGATGPALNDEAMVLRYDNDGFTYTGLPGDEKWVYNAPYYSEIEANTVGINSLDVGQNWAGEGVKSLSLSFQGHPISDGFYDSGAWPAYEQTGRGRDIEGKHDEFHYFSKYPLTTAGTIQVQVDDIEDTNPWSKAGVMIRDKWTPYSKYVAVFVTPGNGITFQYRDVEDGPTTVISKPGVSAPQYVRLIRNLDDSFEAGHSDDGSVWEDVNAPGNPPVFPIITLGTIADPNVYIGTAVTSHDALATCTANFSNLDMFPLPFNWRFGNIGTNDPEQLYVALEDTVGNVSAVEHNDSYAATLTEWQEWTIPLTAFTGVDFNSIKKVYIGLGDRYTHPDAGGSGIVYIDDIRLYKSVHLFVDAGAPAGGDGSSWADAYNHLQDALAQATSGDEICVSEGAYKPDATSSIPSGNGDRTATFQLINGVSLKGGYAGFGEPDPNARDIDAYPTILSGDIGTAVVNTDNSYHVVTGSGTESSAILEGFTITGGNANGSSPHNCGGGMLSDSSSPTVTNCTFSGNNAVNDGGGMRNSKSSPTVTDCTFNNNTASYGGGIYNYDNSSPTLTNCTFSGNEAAYSGGGMINYLSSSPTMTDCHFSDNTAGADGGGMWNGGGSDPTVTDCNFTDNSAQQAGGIFNDNSGPTVINCTFSGNSATGIGGGMYNFNYSSPKVTNCTFTGNTSLSVTYGGGGMTNWLHSNPKVTNCTFSGNSANCGGGIINNSSSSPTVTNCILWGNSPDQIVDYDSPASTTTVSFSDVQGGWPDANNTNIDADPLFADPNNPDPNLRSLRLRWGSPCIDAGESTVLLAISVAYDLDGKDRYIGIDTIDDTGSGLFKFLDMGAYEFDCSGIAGDINCDGVVDFKDLAILCNNWLAGTEP